MLHSAGLWSSGHDLIKAQPQLTSDTLPELWMCWLQVAAEQTLCSFHSELDSMVSGEKNVMIQLRLASTLQGYFTHCQGVEGCNMTGLLLSWLGVSGTPAVGKHLTSKTGRTNLH